ncbi:MAG TPA: hypothetical protein VKU80_15515 [Planctomycetota bacterium]|nr:hypothetical protein [Planctomycetota bacterium]
MGTYASCNPDVANRMPWLATPSASTKPTQTAIDEWVTEAEAEITAVLSMQGLVTPVTNTNGIAILKAKVASYATSRWIDALPSGTNLEGKDSGKLMQEYLDFLKLAKADVAAVATMLGQAPGTSGGGAEAVRSYITENPDGLSLTNNDFDAVATRSSTSIKPTRGPFA